LSGVFGAEYMDFLYKMFCLINIGFREGQDPPLQWHMEVSTINPNFLFDNKCKVLSLNDLEKSQETAPFGLF